MRSIFLLIITILLPLPAIAVNVPIQLFPITNYQQDIDQWIKPSDPDYNKRLLSKEYQQKRLKEYYNHYFNLNDIGASSPWNSYYINRLLRQSPSIKTLEGKLIQDYSNTGKTADKIGYGENFHPLSAYWIKHIANNINLPDQLTYQASRRAIAVRNLNARVLPTHDPHFYHFTIAGQGYPFDNLQMSSLWVGTPIYIVAYSKDKAWALVITPSYIAWVPTNGIARVDDQFITIWTNTAKKNMAAIIHTHTPLYDSHGRFLYNTYVGTVLPLVSVGNNKVTILAPTVNAHGIAVIKESILPKAHANIMPLAATKYNFSILIKTLQNRPYGWGGLYFYNDCSQELKSLFAPFGIWLPRHSSFQVDMGKLDDESKLGMSNRINYLRKNGHGLLTIVYIGGHVFLYLGQYYDPSNPNKKVLLTYQNMWGLGPLNKEYRAVIGAAVLLPLLAKFPEDPRLNSQANKTYFQISYLDQWPKVEISKLFNLHNLVNPEFK